MKITSREISLETRGSTDVIDITEDLDRILKDSRLADGFAALFVRGSTAALSTIEYEPNLVRDLKAALDRLIPSSVEYAHTRTWGDFNGHSHIRATIIGPSIVVPFTCGRLELGTWQQVILVDFDTGPRSRTIIVRLVGTQ